MLISVLWCVFRSCLLTLNERTTHANYNSQLRWILQWPLWSDQTGHHKICRSPKKFLAKMVWLFWHVKKNSVWVFADKFSQTITTVVKYQIFFSGGQNGLTVLAKIICNSVENIFDHLVRQFWPIFYGKFLKILWPLWSTVVWAMDRYVSSLAWLPDKLDIRCSKRSSVCYISWAWLRHLRLIFRGV